MKVGIVKIMAQSTVLPTVIMVKFQELHTSKMDQVLKSVQLVTNVLEEQRQLALVFIKIN
jgi:hypothetical protein